MESKITIDKDTCILCGKCVDVCGSNTLEIIDNTLVQTLPDLCIACAHCANVCPTDSITEHKNSMHSFSINKINEELTEIEKLLQTKRSVRNFLDKKIDEETIEKMIFYAEKAPSSSNARKREYIIVTDKNKIFEIEKESLKNYNTILKILNPFLLKILKIFSKKMWKNLNSVRTDVLQMNKQFASKEYPIFRNAPCIVFIIAPKNEIQAQDDCIIAQQYMMLYAHSRNIGSCIIGYAQYMHKKLEKLLKIHKHKSIYTVSTFGYSKYSFTKEIEYKKQAKYTII